MRGVWEVDEFNNPEAEAIIELVSKIEVMGTDLSG